MTTPGGVVGVTVAPATSPGPDDGCFARFHFGTGRQAGAAGCDHFMTLDVAAGPPLCEEWRVAAPVSHDRDGDIALSVAGEHALLHWTGPVGDDVRAVTRDVYRRLLRCLAASGHPHIVKVWNHVPDITRGEGDGERYRQFCLGRGEAFDEILPGTVMPAGTAVGADAATALQILILAERSPPRGIENPRQVSAFRYPRRYGPRSPSFSRASMTAGGQLFVSGTASIVGHESRHEGSLEQQIMETVRNWKSLLGRAAEVEGASPLTLDEVRAFRVYVRETYCMEIVQRAMAAAGVDLSRVVPLRAGICRRELLFELDGIVDGRASGEPTGTRHASLTQAT